MQKGIVFDLKVRSKMLKIQKIENKKMLNVIPIQAF